MLCFDHMPGLGLSSLFPRQTSLTSLSDFITSPLQLPQSRRRERPKSQTIHLQLHLCAAAAQGGTTSRSCQCVVASIAYILSGKLSRWPPSLLRFLLVLQRLAEHCILASASEVGCLSKVMARNIWALLWSGSQTDLSLDHHLAKVLRSGSCQLEAWARLA